MNGLPTTPEEKRELAEYYVREKCSIGQAARVFRIDAKTASSILKELNVPRNEINFKYKPDPKDPTEEEIAEACRELHARKVFPEDRPREYSVPMYGSYGGGGHTRIFEEMG